MCRMDDEQVLLTKKEFVDIINKLRESGDLVKKVDALFRDAYSAPTAR